VAPPKKKEQKKNYTTALRIASLALLCGTRTSGSRSTRGRGRGHRQGVISAAAAILFGRFISTRPKSKQSAYLPMDGLNQY